jgi:putative sigma-54 modulation protein
MQLNVTAKGVTIPPRFREVAERKLTKLGRLLSPINTVDITCSHERQWRRVEITLNANGLVVRGEERALELQPALESLIDKLEKQVKRSRSRLIDRYRQAPETREAWALEETEETEALAEEEEEPVAGSGMVVRMKRVAVKPMTPEEAAAQMELLGHDFFVFRNAETEQVNVLYRRRDGNYGLIEPEVR